MPSTPIHRREFFRRAGVAGGALAWSAAAQTGGAVSLVRNPDDPAVSAAPATWAVDQFRQALVKSGVTVNLRQKLEEAPAGEFCVVICGLKSAPAVAALKTANVVAPDEPESLALLSTRIGTREVLIAAGADARGVMYAVLELAERVTHPNDPRGPLHFAFPVVERPSNEVRSVMRQFVSEQYDKPWLQDRAMWPGYLSMLAANRFNRFHLAFGLAYDFLQRVEDSYLLFAYPFFLNVPGYSVRATNLPDEERDRNLAALQYISEQTAARGIDFQIGLWMHGYRYADSPHAKYLIEGLNNDNHAAYCRDALTALLQACPAISSVALRIHGESGVAEGSYDFWRTIFDGVKRCGRRVEIDLHAKGIDQTMISNALDTYLPVNVSAKYWAEHLGMPYHQTAIRDLEMPVEGHTGGGLMTLSEGQRVFTRYGYADLLRHDRRYTLRHRIFSGTQRLLLWGDAAFAAGYARAFRFGGSNGADWMEPLTCRGRRGSSGPSTRLGYADASLAPEWDWQKYSYWYRLHGRLMYDPGTNWEVLRREMWSPTAEAALASASRILPIVTTAHLPSAACDSYWPEIYWNQPIVAVARANPYGDTPAPRTFPNVSPLDPQLFSRIGDFAREMLKGQRSGKYSPIEVAQWLEDLASASEGQLIKAGTPQSAEFRRLAIDVHLQVGLGRFFAAKFRSGVLYTIHEQTGDRAALTAAIESYKNARGAWAAMEKDAGAYAADLSMSDRYSERGQWNDRLKLIDEDIAQMEQRLPSAKALDDEVVRAAVAEALARPRRETARVRHQTPVELRHKEAVPLRIALNGRASSVRLYYRHVNQAERHENVEMELRGGTYSATIPAEYADSPYHLQYYFEIRQTAAKAWLYPGFTPDLANQPYFMVMRA